MNPRMTTEEADALLATMTPDDFVTASPDNEIDDSTIERLVITAHEMIARKGRPSLTAPGKRSPQITLRLSEADKTRLARVASMEERRQSDVVRSAIEQYLNERLAA